MRALSTEIFDEPWDVYYGRLTAFKAEHGDCRVPLLVVTADGNKLGSWVSRQRQMSKGDDGGLSKERTTRLEELDFVWNSLDAAWDEGYKRLKAFQAEHGDCLVPSRVVATDGQHLGSWVDIQGQKRKGKRGELTEEHLARLEALGFVWDATR
ncbi:helicase-associated [Pelagophyceae sp. CCMP2097]|nr:helicase-associated [Pelagophyceae sp. CCMP2097]